MSTCISRHGEWSDHILDDVYTCTRCLVLDEDALVAELRQARSRLAEVEAERDAAIARERNVWDRINTYNDDPVTRLKALALLDGEYDAMKAERDAARVDLEAARPVVEAADAYATAMKVIGAYRPDADPSLDRLGELADAQRTSREALLAAVDLYRSATTRNLDSALPDPSLTAETLPTTEEKP